MKNKKMIIALLIIILIAVAGTIYYKVYNEKINQEEAYIKIYIGKNVGMTALYVPESCYEINKSGTIKYIGNVDEKEFDILGRIKKGKFKELEEMIMNAPEDSFSSNNDYWKDYGNKYYHIEVLNNRYRTTNYAGEEIIEFIKENI